MIPIKPGLKVQNQDFAGKAFDGTIKLVDEDEKYDGDTLISAYCTIRFDSGDTFTNMYVMQDDIIKR